jgi:hypothetical protein
MKAKHRKKSLPQILYQMLAHSDKMNRQRKRYEQLYVSCGSVRKMKKYCKGMYRANFIIGYPDSFSKRDVQWLFDNRKEQRKNNCFYCSMITPNTL